MTILENLKDMMARIPASAKNSYFDRIIEEKVKKSRTSIHEETDKYYQLATMLLYELYPEGKAMEMAQRSAALKHVPSVFRDQKKKGWSYNETLFSLTEGYAGFSDKCRKEMPQNPEPLKTLDAKHPLACYFMDITGVFVLSEENRVYAYRDKDGYLVLISYVDTAHAVLGDEDKFNNEPPMWFTECSHFRSPVWALKEVRGALLRMMAATGMARVPIRLEVVFVHKECFMINLEDMWDYHWGPINLTIYRADKANDPLDTISYDQLPMHHLWQYYYSLAHSVAFNNPTGVFDEKDDEEDEDDEDDDEDEGDLDDDFDLDFEELIF